MQQEKSYSYSSTSLKPSGNAVSLRDNIWHMQTLLLSILTVLNEMKKLRLTSRRIKLLEDLAVKWEVYCSTFTEIVFRSRRTAECIDDGNKGIATVAGRLGSCPHDDDASSKELEGFIDSPIRYKHRAERLVDDIELLYNDVIASFDCLRSLVDDRPLRAILFSTIAEAHEHYIKMYKSIEQDIGSLNAAFLHCTKSEPYYLPPGYDEKYPDSSQVVANTAGLKETWMHTIADLSLAQGAANFAIKSKGATATLYLPRVKKILDANDLVDASNSHVEPAVRSQFPIL